MHKLGSGTIWGAWLWPSCTEVTQPFIDLSIFLSSPVSKFLLLSFNLPTNKKLLLCNLGLLQIQKKLISLRACVS